MHDDGQLVEATRAGQAGAFDQLVDRWLDPCWEVAWRILHDRDLAADVAQDTLLAAWERLDTLQQPASFGGWVLRIARNRALNRLERERWAMPTGDETRFERGGDTAGVGDPEADLHTSGQQELVWAAATALGERDTSLLDLHLRHGLEPGELAEELGVSANAAHQALFRLRNRLGDAIRAWLLWHGGEPACVVLRAELTAAGIESFGAPAVRAIGQHVETCEDCEEERDRVTAPAALFSAVPLVVMPAALRTQVLAGLARGGAPVRTDRDGPDRDGSDGGDGPMAPDGSSPMSGAATSTVPVGTARTLGRLRWPAAVLCAAAATLWWVSKPLPPPTPVEPVAVEVPAEAALEPPDPDPAPDPEPVAPPPAAITSAEVWELLHGPLPQPDEPVDEIPEATAPESPPAESPPADDPPDQAPPQPDEPEPDDPEPDEPEPEDPEPDDPPAPIIDEFVVTSPGPGSCAVGEVQYFGDWRTSNATVVTIAVEDGEPQAVPTTGSTSWCLPTFMLDPQFTLTADGDGGTASQTTGAG